jgi:CheY-like chemotaxis protein
VAQSAPAKALSETRPAARGSDAHHLVMVVDDDADTRKVISRMLQSEGHYVVEVSHGSQVADLALRHRPEVITLDMIMPGVDGLEVLRRLKADEKTRSIPVVCISISEDLSPQALQLGAALFIRKPLETKKLLDAIEKVCQTAAGQTG